MIGAIVLGVLVLVVASSTAYMVQPEEVGVVTRFGRYVRQTPPGLHFKWPWGIEEIRRVKVQLVHTAEFGFRTEEPGIRTRYTAGDFTSESLMLTGDLNIANVGWVVQYRIGVAHEYLFGVRDPEQALRDASEAVMREVVGDRSVTEVLTEGRTEVNAEAKLRLQEVLDTYGTGLSVVDVKLQDVTPPAAVKDSFNEVNRARQEKEQTINQAYEGYNRVVPLAEGEAEQTIAEAEGYRIDRVNRAQGDAERFRRILAEYQKAPEVTRTRLYLEMLNRILPRIQRKILTEPGSATGVLPLLHLGEARPVGEEPRSGPR